LTRFVFYPQAKRDINEAIAWYDRRQDGLGDKFQQALENALSKLEQNPLGYPRVRGPWRRILLAKFPYRVVYRTAGETIYVAACTHGRRHPKRWRRRL